MCPHTDAERPESAAENQQSLLRVELKGRQCMAISVVSYLCPNLVWQNSAIKKIKNTHIIYIFCWRCSNIVFPGIRKTSISNHNQYLMSQKWRWKDVFSLTSGRRLFPDVGNTSSSWYYSNVVFLTSEKLPYIQRIDGQYLTSECLYKLRVCKLYNWEDGAGSKHTVSCLSFQSARFHASNPPICLFIWVFNI